MSRQIGCWPAAPISELCDAVVDCVNKTAPVVDIPTPFRMIRTTNIRSGRVDTENVRYVDRPTYETWSRRGRLKAGDIILTREAPLGEVGLLRDPEGVFLGQRLVMYRADPQVADNRFLAYALQSPWVQAEIRSLGSGSTVEHMRVPDCERLSIPCPPLEVQRKIGEALGSFDDLIENNRRRIKILEETARLIYREWFVHFRFPGHEYVDLVDSDLGPIPEGWSVGTLGDMAEEIRASVKPSPETAAIPYVPIDVIGSKQLTLAEWKPGDDAKSSLRLFEQGDVLFGAMRAYFHKVCIAPFNGVTRSTCFVLRPKSDRYAFAVLSLASAETVAYASAHSSGSTIPYAKWAGVLERMPCVKPPAQTCTKFAGVIDPMLELARNLVGQNRLLAEARDLLLPRLISGELDVSDLDLDLDSVA